MTRFFSVDHITSNAAHCEYLASEISSEKRNGLQVAGSEGKDLDLSAKLLTAFQVFSNIVEISLKYSNVRKHYAACDKSTFCLSSDTANHFRILFPWPVAD